MINEISGNQWNEGDVSCSAVRRIALPDAFFAIDGILDTSIFILDSINVHEDNIAQELDRFLPVLLSSRLLVLAVKAGVGREVAHEQIKNHVRLAEIDIRKGKGNTFLQRVIEDRLLKIEAKDIAALLQNPIELAGAAKIQTVEIVNQIRSLIKNYPTSFSYKPVSVI
jgi:adenylosuccinate lyase